MGREAKFKGKKNKGRENLSKFEGTKVVVPDGKNASGVPQGNLAHYDDYNN